jgi:hypothetical protein
MMLVIIYIVVCGGWQRCSQCIVYSSAALTWTQSQPSATASRDHSLPTLWLWHHGISWLASTRPYHWSGFLGICRSFQEEKTCVTQIVQLFVEHRPHVISIFVISISLFVFLHKKFNFLFNFLFNLLFDFYSVVFILSLVVCQLNWLIQFSISTPPFFPSVSASGTSHPIQQCWTISPDLALWVLFGSIELLQ